MVLRADAQEHGVKLTLEENAPSSTEAVLDAVHHALHGVALAQIDAEELVVRVEPRRGHEPAVEAHLKD
jgi:hypothetical protein